MRRLIDVMASSLHSPATRFLLAAAVSLAALQLAGASAQDFQHRWFCGPSARVAGWFLGAPSGETPDGDWVIFHPALAVTVGMSCSGFGFFCLLYSLASGLAFRHLAPGRALLHSLALLPGAYAATILINASRVAVSFHARLATEGWHERLAGKAHFGAGMAVFLTSLVLIYLCMERKYTHVCR